MIARARGWRAASYDLVDQLRARHPQQPPRVADRRAAAVRLLDRRRRRVPDGRGGVRAARSRRRQRPPSGGARGRPDRRRTRRRRLQGRALAAPPEAVAQAAALLAGAARPLVGDPRERRPASPSSGISIDSRRSAGGLSESHGATIVLTGAADDRPMVDAVRSGLAGARVIDASGARRSDDARGAARAARRARHGRHRADAPRGRDGHADRGALRPVGSVAIRPARRAATGRCASICRAVPAARSGCLPSAAAVTCPTAWTASRSTRSCAAAAELLAQARRGAAHDPGDGGLLHAAGPRDPHRPRVAC